MTSKGQSLPINADYQWLRSERIHIYKCSTRDASMTLSFDMDLISLSMSQHRYFAKKEENQQPKMTRMARIPQCLQPLLSPVQTHKPDHQ